MHHTPSIWANAALKRKAPSSSSAVARHPGRVVPVRIFAKKERRKKELRKKEETRKRLHFD